MNEFPGKGPQSDATIFDLRRRRVLQAAIAASGLHALGTSASEPVSGLVGDGGLFGNGFEPSPPTTMPIGGAFIGTASAHLFSSGATGAIQEPVTFGLALVEGEFPQSSGITVSGLTSHQVEIRNRWPDDSAKFVVISGRCTIPAGGSLVASLSRGTAATGTALNESQLLASGVEATLRFADGPVMTLSALIGVQALSDATGLVRAGRVRQISSGPQMSSWLYAARLSNSNAHLIGWMEVRFYGGTRVHVLPWIENGFVRLAGCAGQVGTLVFTLQGTTRFSVDEVHLANHCRVYAQSAGLGHWSGTAPDLYAAPDPLYLQSTGLAPPFDRRDTSAATARLNGLAQAYSPVLFGQLRSSPRNSGGNGLDNGDFDPGMGDAGYHAGIGPLPEWDVFYLTSKADRRAWNAVIANAMGYGRYGVHWRDELTLAPVNPTDVPNKTLAQLSLPLFASTATRNSHGLADVGANQFGAAETLPPAAGYVMGDGRNLLPEYWAMTHHPSGGFLGYLLTGHEAFIELNQMVAGTCFLRQNNVHREYASGVQHTWRETVRGQAWALRSIFQAATISRDGSALQTGWSTIAANNINAYHLAYIASPCAALGIPRPYSNAFNAGNAPYRINGWELDFSVSAWGYGLAMKPPVSGTALANMRAYFHWHAQWVVGRLGPLGDANAYGFNCAARNNSFAISNTATDAPWIGNAGPFVASWGEHFQLTHGASNATNTTNTIGAFDANNGNFPDATSYWSNFQMGLAYAVLHGAAGAWSGYLRMVRASNWGQFDAAAATFPVGSLRSPNSPPAWAGSIAPNAFTALAGTQFKSWGVANIAGGPFRGTAPIDSIVNSYNDPAYDPIRKTWYFYGGGHGDGSCNAVIECDPLRQFAYRVAVAATPASTYLPQYMQTTAPLSYPSGIPLQGFFLSLAEGLDPVLDAQYAAPQMARVVTHMYAAAAYRKGKVHYFYLTYGEADVASGRWSGRGVSLNNQLQAIFANYGNSSISPSIRAIYDEVTDRFFVTMPNEGWRNGIYVFDPNTRQITSVHDCIFGVMLEETPMVKVGRKLYCFRRIQSAGFSGPQNLNQGFIVDMDQMAAASGRNAMQGQAFTLVGDIDGSTYQASATQETIPCYWDGVAIRRWNYQPANRQFIYSVNITPEGGTGTTANPLILRQTRRTLAGTAPTSTLFVYSRLVYDEAARAAICIPRADSDWFALRLLD